MKHKRSHNRIYLHYKSAPHPSHKYQGEAVDCKFTYYALSPFLNKRYYLVVSEGFRPSISGFCLKRLHLTNKHINIMLGDFAPSVAEKGLSGLINLIYKDCDGIIANSTLTSEIFQKYFGEKYAHKFRICWPLANTKYLVGSKPFWWDTRQEPRLCYFGDLTYLTGADLLPRILCEIRNEFGKGLHMDVIGTGPFHEYLQREAKRIEGLNVFGFQPYNVVKTILAKCQVIIYPARFEAFGLPVVETMAAGLIPIVTKMTGARDFVKQVDPRLVVSVDLNSICERVIQVLSLGLKERIEISAKARSVTLSYNVDKLRTSFLQALSDLGVLTKRW